MAKNCTIKQDLLRDERLFEAEVFSKLPLRLVLIGLIFISDKDGEFEWRPNQLKLDILPYDCLEMSQIFDELLKNKFIDKYEDSDKVYGVIRYKKKIIKIKKIKDVYDPEIPEHVVLQYLIEKTGTSFKFVPSNLKPIISILKEKEITVDVCKKVIDLKYLDWFHNENMFQYLKPSTLFRRVRFYEYLPFIERLPDKPKSKMERVFDLLEKKEARNA